LHATILVIASQLETDLLEAYLRDAKPLIAVAKAASAVQGLAILESPRPADLVLLWLPAPWKDAMEAVREMLRRRPDTPVALLSSDASAQAVRAAAGAGASGLISTHLSAPAFMATLRRLLAGERCYSDPEYEDRRSVPRGAADIIVDSLTPRERQALMHLTKGRSNKEIAKEMGIETVTVTLHLPNLYRKLAVPGRAHASRLAVAAGLHLDDRWLHQLRP